MKITDFTKEKGTQNWFVRINDDLEIFTPGTNSEPDVEKFNELIPVIEDINSIKEKAIHLLEDFMKDKGEWWLNSVFFGEEAKINNCAFVLEFGFEADNNPHEYNYTGFKVCFSNPMNNTPPLNKPHPFKFIVEFS